MGATSVWRTAAALALVVSVAGCGVNATDTAQQPASSDEAFWSNIRITGDEVDAFGTLPDMAARSDAVILGRFGEVTGSRAVGGPVDQGGVVYTQVEVVVDEVLAGSVPGNTVTLEPMAQFTPDTKLPAGQMMLFLVDKGGNEAGLWRPLNSRGLWAATERAAVDTPLNEEPPRNDPKYAQLVSGASSIQDLIDDL